MQPRLDSSERLRQCLRNLSIGQLSPGVQEKDLALNGTKIGECRSECALSCLRVSPLDRLIFLLTHAFELGTSVGTKHPSLATPVMAEKIGRDPVEPGPDGTRQVEIIPTPIGDRECLSG